MKPKTTNPIENASLEELHSGMVQIGNDSLNGDLNNLLRRLIVELISAQNRANELASALSDVENNLNEANIKLGKMRGRLDKFSDQKKFNRYIGLGHASYIYEAYPMDKKETTNQE